MKTSMDGARQRRALHRLLGRLGATLLLACGIATAANDSGDRIWGVRDSIAVRYVVSLFDLPGELAPTASDRSIVWSPGGRRFFFMTRHGDLACDCTTYELHVFDAADLTSALAREGADASSPQPLRTVTFSSSRSDPYFQGISEPHWETEDTVLFFGVQGDGPRHVYRLNVRTGITAQLTSGSRDVIAYAVQDSSIVYGVRDNKPRTALDEYPVHAVTDDDLLQLGGATAASLELIAAQNEQDSTSLGGFVAPLYGPWMAPDCKHAIVAVRLSRSSAGRFMIIDMQGKRMRPLLDAPLGTVTQAGRYTVPQVLWSSDGERAALVNTALPTDDDVPERQRTPYIVEVELGTGHWRIVAALVATADVDSQSAPQAVIVEWSRQDREILVRRQGRKNAAIAAYARSAARWVPKKPGPMALRNMHSAVHALQATVKQSANEPPVPIVSNGKFELPLLGPDPALAGVHRARLEPVHWREGNDVVTGGLMLPSERASPVPLVIQASTYVPDLFLPDGTSTTAFAAQALVSAGMAVLFIDVPSDDPDDQRRSVTGTVREGTSFVDRIDAAVDAISRQYGIDAARTGMIGFSRSGFMTYYAITHPGKVKLAAAVIADAWTASYGEYVVSAAAFGTGGNSEFQTYYGGGTFWENKQSWLEHAPAFNIDRVVTPTLFTVGNKPNNLLYLETVGAFRLNRRPFEYLTFRDGAHQLQRPRERLASLAASVDWMAFWLLGREDPDPAKLEVYRRWKGIKDRWERVQGEESRGAEASSAHTSVPH